jgi:hypothetical protein
MAKVTTEICRKFLADHFRSNPVLMHYFSQGDKVSEKALTDPKQWIRETKMSIETYVKEQGNWGIDAGKINVFPDGCSINRYGESDSYETLESFLLLRIFYCKPFEDSVKYCLLQRKDDTLVLGPYVGD